MAYTEIKQRNDRKYYYRAISVRAGKKVKKKRIYLGPNLPFSILSEKENIADIEFRSAKINKGLQPITSKIIKVLKKYNVKKAGIFGSYARGEQKRNSDIDILIEPPRGAGFKFAGIALELEENLGKKVDLVSYNGIYPLLKNKILKEEKHILNG